MCNIRTFLVNFGELSVAIPLEYYSLLCPNNYLAAELGKPMWKELKADWQAPLGGKPGLWRWFIDSAIVMAVLRGGFQLDGWIGFFAAGFLLSWIADLRTAAPAPAPAPSTQKPAPAVPAPARSICWAPAAKGSRR
jgi:hypothetical protein